MVVDADRARGRQPPHRRTATPWSRSTPRPPRRPSRSPRRRCPPRSWPRDQVAALERALRIAKENLQTTIEELEASNEELQATNEELVASNEELKTTNEELQSVNQELFNVNAEHQHKIGELTQLTEDMDLLLGSTEVHTLFLDRELRIRRFTPLIAEVFHLVASDVGRRIEAFNHALREPAIYAEAQRVVATGAPFEQQVGGAGDTWYLLRILPYRRGAAIDGAVLTLIDITGLKRAESVAREAATRRDHFLAALSHELRNPLAALLNAARVLERGPLPADEVATWHRLLLDRAQHMTRLVDDLLDVARLTQNKLVLQRAELDLAATTRGVLEEVEPAFRERGVRLRTDADTGLIVSGDATRLHQLQVNLLTNAARHAPTGSEVHYAVRRAGDWAEICVTDHGSGIAPELLGKIFELFVQGDRPGARGGDSGLGVGLALVRWIAELHGGTAEASSAGVGQGAEFHVRIPLAAPGRATQPAMPAMPAALAGPAPGQPRTVLLVDDDRSSRVAMARLLELDGISVATATTGAEALARLGDAPAPELVLLDLGLPGMDGLEVCRRIRALPGGHALLVLALTGFGQDTDRDATRRAGFDGHLTKPVDVGEVYALYARCRAAGARGHGGRARRRAGLTLFPHRTRMRDHRRGSTRERSSCGNQAAGAARLPARGVLVCLRKMRSLVISPFAAERLALAELLRREGHEVTAVADRAEGLALAALQRPDAVIADAQVPGLDGAALVRALSAHGPMPRLILLCPRAGGALDCDGVTCLTKPIDLAALHRLLAPPASERRAV